ncbi:MAG: hypothetical protein AB7S38_40370 [Vulcanimicrobiota bacterium]
MQDRKALREALNRGRAKHGFTAPELGEVIEELRPTLREKKVAVPAASFSQNHVWNTPNGEKVYLN